MASKWSFLKDRYPQAPLSDDRRYVDQVATNLREYSDLTLVELAHLYDDLFERKDQIDRELQDVKARLDATASLVGARLDDQGLESVVINGYRWTPVYDPYPSVRDKAKLRAWAADHMPDNLTLHPQTLRAVVRDALDPDAGSFELPPGVDIFVKRSFRRTKQS